MDLTLKKIAGFAAILACLIGGAPAEAGIFSRKKAPKETAIAERQRGNGKKVCRCKKIRRYLRLSRR